MTLIPEAPAGFIPSHQYSPTPACTFMPLLPVASLLLLLLGPFSLFKPSCTLFLQVDDMRLNRLVLGRMLTKLGFEVVEADNGLAAIEQFIFHQPALSCVLLDLQMPVLDGWETAKRLRGLEAVSAWARVPIVACTALSPQENWHSHDTVAGSALSSGCDDLLVSS